MHASTCFINTLAKLNRAALSLIFATLFSTFLAQFLKCIRDNSIIYKILLFPFYKDDSSNAREFSFDSTLNRENFFY